MWSSSLLLKRHWQCIPILKNKGWRAHLKCELCSESSSCDGPCCARVRLVSLDWSNDGHGDPDVRKGGSKVVFLR